MQLACPEKVVSRLKVMKYRFQFIAVVLVGFISLSSSSTRPSELNQPGTPEGVSVADVRPIVVNTGKAVDEQLDVGTLIRNLRESLEESRPYDSIRIVSQLGKLGPKASPAVDLLIDLLGKQLPDCSEELRICPDRTRNCLIEKRICPEGAELHNYDYLTPYAFGALKQIGASALPRLSAALDDETPTSENMERRKLVAGVLGAIGRGAIPFISGSMCASNYSRRVLALAVLNTVVSKDPASGNQLANLTPCITPFLGGNFETTDQAIDILGAIGPDAAAAAPQLIELLKYERVLGFGACPVGERIG